MPEQDNIVFKRKTESIFKVIVIGNFPNHKSP